MENVTIKRLDELEAKSVFQEDTIERLSSEMRIQQKEIMALRDELNSLKDSLVTNLLDDPDQKPPHY
tara:strand:- start:28373 stop:28573 length:201 start_codon:yes stop_codon:yes gene_type:complete